MGKKLAKICVLGVFGFFFITLLISSGGVTQEKAPLQYKVISTQDFLKVVNPNPSERLRVEALTPKEGKNINGILSTLPPAKPGQKPAYHYHTHREGIIQILSGDATEWIEGKPVPLKV